MSSQRYIVDVVRTSILDVVGKLISPTNKSDVLTMCRRCCKDVEKRHYHNVEIMWITNYHVLKMYVHQYYKDVEISCYHDTCKCSHIRWHERT